MNSHSNPTGPVDYNNDVYYDYEYKPEEGNQEDGEEDAENVSAESFPSDTLPEPEVTSAPCPAGTAIEYATKAVFEEMNVYDIGQVPKPVLKNNNHCGMSQVCGELL